MTETEKTLSIIRAARIFHRLVKAKAKVSTDGSELNVRLASPLNRKQRQAIDRDKPTLINIADWYADDIEDIRTMTEEQFVSVASTYVGWRQST